VIVNPSEQDYRDIYKLMIGVIVPRPIAFVSTICPAGSRNLAPFSFFTGTSANPPVICGPTYTRTSDRFDMVRPKTGEVKP
jgi:flavin reductase (DIM6/NTAB) family NADH-FMN oxidoreductase RutF